MGQIQPVKPVKFIVGILAIKEDILPKARELVTQQLGTIDLLSPIWPFTSTEYYAKEMSKSLVRQFVSLSQLEDPTHLVELKLVSNSVELADACDRNRDERRAINLDPGYITPAKLVLATTKDYSHRVYLGRGIYAEATLHYHAGAWNAWPWTYPDYAASIYHQFFCEVRDRLLEQLRAKADGRRNIQGKQATSSE